MIKNTEETKKPNTNEEHELSNQYEPRLSREEEKAAIVFKKMQYRNYCKYRLFLEYWAAYWPEDIRCTDKAELKRQVKAGRLDGSENDTWRKRYRWYLDKWGKWRVPQLSVFIVNCREPELPEQIQKRLYEHELRAFKTDDPKKLGGYKLKQRFINDAGKTKWGTIEGWQFDLSLADITSKLAQMDKTKGEV